MFFLVRSVDVKVDILILSFGEIKEADMVSRPTVQSKPVELEN